MKILNTQVMTGPNYWSNHRKKLIVMKIDLEKYEEFPSNLLPGLLNDYNNSSPLYMNIAVLNEQLVGFMSDSLKELG